MDFYVRFDATLNFMYGIIFIQKYLIHSSFKSKLKLSL